MKTVGTIVWKGLLYFQRAFMIVAGCAVAVLVFVEVMLRYVFGSPLFGVEEMVCMVAMWLYFMGASYGAFERSHIKADVAHLWFHTSRSRTVITTISSFITVVLAVIMVSWTLPYFIWGLKEGETSQALLLPMVWSQSALFFGAIMMTLYFLAEFIDHLLECFGKTAVFKPLAE